MILATRAGDRSSSGRGRVLQFREQRLTAFERENSTDLLQFYQGDVSQAAREARFRAAPCIVS